MNFFGEPWPSGVCDDGVQAETPVGEPCLLCSEPIAQGDQGNWMGSVNFGSGSSMEPVHRECSLRSVLGGIEHLTAGPHAVGTCYLGSQLTHRQSSLLAWEWFQQRGHPAATESATRSSGG